MPGGTAGTEGYSCTMTASKTAVQLVLPCPCTRQSTCLVAVARLEDDILSQLIKVEGSAVKASEDGVVALAGDLEGDM